MDADHKLLVSLHDVTPRHAQAVRSILQWLEAREIPPVPLLVVPDFHGQWPLAAYPDFCQELLGWQRRGHELVLHGYTHLESPPEGKASLGTRLQRRFMTAGEGEFLALPPVQVAERLQQGLSMWHQAELDFRPTGFIPPAWLHRADLDPVLWEQGFEWTEDHTGMRFRDGKRVASPVVTWASRDPLRRLGSRLFCPAAVQWQSNAPLLRLAIHPHDFDYPQLIRSIDRTLATARRDRRLVGTAAIHQTT